MTADDIWNAMVDLISGMDYPTGDAAKDEAFLLFQFHSAMEGGGHESFLNLFEEDIEKVGPSTFFHGLIQSLIRIGGAAYAEIEKKYGLPLWQGYKALEEGGLEEEAFYVLIEKADKKYTALDPQMDRLLKTYFEELYGKWRSN